MQLHTNEKLASRLRFKEFQDKWEKQSLGQLTIKAHKKNKDNISYPIYSINNTEGFLPQSEQFEGLDSNLRKYDISIYKIVQPKTFAYNPARINIGSIGYNYDLKDIIISSLYICFKTKKELDDNYLRIYLKTYNFNTDILRYQEGGVRQYLFYENFSMIKIPLPSLPEQKKIASFLTSVDNKLNQLTKKKKLLNEYKKGVMQKIFSQELRFKDDNGNNYPDWEMKKLEEVIYFFNGKGHEQDVTSDGLFIIVNSRFISTNGQVKKYTNFQKCPLEKDNIVMVMSDVPNGKALAKCYYIEKDSLYSLNQRICGLKQKSINMKLLFYLLNRNKYFLKFDSGVGQTNLKKSEVLNCPLFIPSSINEQKKIAEFLIAIDNKIEVVNLQLEKTKEFKKGLLQQMFV
tara:strand:- start:1140 stop:2345 length:1206 start_codon:yes stop_codon:yes gene_type:complete